MKKSAKKDAMITKFARTVGHTAGTVAKATQGLAASAVALVRTKKTRPDEVRRKPARTSTRHSTRPRPTRPHSTAKKKSKGAPPTRRSRERSP